VRQTILKMKSLIGRLLMGEKRTNEEGIVLSLKYKNQKMGKLWFGKGKYYFEYDDSFKTTNLRPLTGFENLGMVYESARLFLFFVMRIPDLKRVDLTEVVKTNHLSPDSSPLRKLSVLGLKTINDPYVLTLEYY
jgi:hypothetical protein